MHQTPSPRVFELFGTTIPAKQASKPRQRVSRTCRIRMTRSQVNNESEIAALSGDLEPFIASPIVSYSLVCTISYPKCKTTE